MHRRTLAPHSWCWEDDDEAGNASVDPGGNQKARRVNLDAMIRREDFAREIQGEAQPDSIRELQLSQLLPSSPIRRLLRKPDFQRETNHWSPDQVTKFIKSFLDGDVIPSIILWPSANFIFVIDGAHRLSALCAWLSDDYGDGTDSKDFYSGEISKEQVAVAKRTRALIKTKADPFQALEQLIGKPSDSTAGRRAGRMFTRPIQLQAVVGTAQTAEDSFFAINQQGTPLDETEEMLIRNRRTPLAIGARSIVRAGLGHNYASSFNDQNQQATKKLAAQLHKLLFEPQPDTPLKTLDLPLGGSASPVDALSVLIDFLAVVNSKSKDKIDPPSSYADDETGDETIKVIKEAIKITKRMTSNESESLGLHPAVYFTNDRGKHSRFLFLGMVATVTEKIRNNDGGWFKKFTKARKAIERFLIDNKSLIGIVLQNLGKQQRIPRMRDMFDFMVVEANAGREFSPTTIIQHLGMKGKIYDVIGQPQGQSFSDDTKSQIVYRTQIEKAPVCPICGGLLDITKSVSFDHIQRVQDGGLGHAENGQLVHPYCNSAMKN